VVLGGVCSVRARGASRAHRRRKSVFEGLPYTLYLPLKTSFTLCDSDCDLAFATAALKKKSRAAGDA